MDTIEQLLTRGVDAIYPNREAFEKILRSGQKLRIYQGFDPTGTQLHIGHMVGLRKLAQLQQLGHHVIFVIGDGTGQAGDPSGKSKSRAHHAFTLSSHENTPGTLKKMLEPFEQEGISLEEIKSQKINGEISFKIIVDEKKYNHEVVARVIRSLGSQGFFTNAQLRENAKNYIQQASKIINFEGDNPVEILYNGDWLNKLNLEDVLHIAGRFSLQQLIERDLFQERMKKGEEVNMREFLYPLLQAYDSVVLNVDLEVGGSDQMFNMLCGRTLAKNILNKEKFILTTPLLADSHGVKIGKSEGNAIALTDQPASLFGKIMSLSDDVIVKGLEYLTDVPMDDIHQISTSIQNGQNPMQFKKMLAFEVIKQLNDKEAAQTAQKEFETRFQEGKLSESDLPLKSMSDFVQTTSILETLVVAGITESNSEARRLIDQHAVKINDTVVTSSKEEIHLKPGDIIRAGRKAIKIKE